MNHLKYIEQNRRYKKLFFQFSESKTMEKTQEENRRKNT